jgi:DNA recombination-dependent growth factor C
MGIYTGTATCGRYRVFCNGKLPTVKKLSDALDPFKAPELRIDGNPKMESIGWVRPLTPMDKDLAETSGHWDASDCQIAGGTLLRVRYERRKVPASLLAMIFRQKLAEHTQSQGKPMGRLERKKLKDSIAQDLLKRSLPMVQFTDLVWRDQESELWIFSSSKSTCEKILQLFGQTFSDPLDLQVSPLDPASAWIEEDDSDHRLQLVTRAEPTVFARQQAM